MVAPLVAAAGISAASSLLGGLFGSSSAKKAAKYQLQATREQIAAAERNRDYQYGLNEGAIGYGTSADDRIAALLGLGGDPAAAQAGFDQYRDSTGYQFRVDEGNQAVNTNAYARGMGDSGATLKALVRYGQGAASDEFGRYMGQLGNVSSAGANARGLVAGVGNNTVSMSNQATQAGADARSNAALAQGQIWGNVANNLAGLAGYAVGNRSSYAPAYTPGRY